VLTDPVLFKSLRVHEIQIKSSVGTGVEVTPDFIDTSLGVTPCLHQRAPIDGSYDINLYSLVYDLSLKVGLTYYIRSGLCKSAQQQEQAATL
jgi:hypothetical protein